MQLQIKHIKEFIDDSYTIFIIDNITSIKQLNLSKDDADYIKDQLSEKNYLIETKSYSNQKTIVWIDKESKKNRAEYLREKGSYISDTLNKTKTENIGIVNFCDNPSLSKYITEGICLSQYKFDKYQTKNKKPLSLKQITIYSDIITNNELNEITTLTESVFWARNMVNEPVNNLNAELLAEQIREKGEEAGFSCNILTKKKIESLKMGGLLAVNKGSIDPPTFSVLEYKPDNHTNSQPIILVGKGVTYDTGGLSLKTAAHMDGMKSDMGGAATVAATIKAIAKNKLPIHVIGLIPATDNRPSGNAYTPGDVITMHNGSTVEVLNTDAEGRLILADAISYAKRYNPAIIISVATLTGSAANAIGPHATVAMGNIDNTIFDKLKNSGEEVHERVVEFPFWDDYNELLKSEIADLKNLGGDYGGAITAGKFLEHFTTFPFLHLDIAGVAYLTKKDKYRPSGGTGIGVRLLYNFIKNF